MTAADFDLETLVAPVGAGAFFRDHWEREPLHVARGDPGYYGGLLSTADVDQVVAFTRPRFGDPSAFSDGKPRAKTFVQGWLADWPLEDGPRFATVEDLRRVYAGGKTVVIMTMQQRWLPVASLCRNLEAAFFCPVHANMYLTPEGAQGFDAHFDTHEVLVLQLEGSKHWRLYGSPRPLPLVGETLGVPREGFGPVREVRLEAGDLLYVPRGFVHEAFTSECHSLHLTVGVNVYRWVDLLHEAVDALARDDVRFRGSVPPGALGGAGVPDGVSSRFAELVEALAAGARVEGALGRLGDQFFGRLAPLPGGQFAAPGGAEDLGEGTVLEKAPGTVCRVVEGGGWVEIQFPGGRVGGPPRIARALRFVAGADRFAVRDLPDDLGAGGKLILGRRLVRERLLRVAGGQAAGEPARGAAEK